MLTPEHGPSRHEAEAGGAPDNKQKTGPHLGVHALDASGVQVRYQPVPDQGRARYREEQRGGRGGGDVRGPGQAGDGEEHEGGIAGVQGGGGREDTLGGGEPRGEEGGAGSARQARPAAAAVGEALPDAAGHADAAGDVDQVLRQGEHAAGSGALDVVHETGPPAAVLPAQGVEEPGELHGVRAVGGGSDAAELDRRRPRVSATGGEARKHRDGPHVP